MVKWMTALAGSLVAMCAIAPAHAQSYVSVPGSFNSEMGCSGDWQPDCAQAQLTLGSDENWRGTYLLPVGSYEFKIAYDQNWDVNYGADGVLNGSNIALNVVEPSATISFIYNPNTRLVDVLFGQPMAVYLPGSFNSEIGCSGDWQPECGLAQMLLAADGLWYAEHMLPGGSYEYKIAYDGSWDVNYGAGGVPNGPNIGLDLADASTVYFQYDPVTHLAVSQLMPFGLGSNGAVPEPSSWVMMLMGFGAIGYSMRRRGKLVPQLA